MAARAKNKPSKSFGATMGKYLSRNYLEKLIVDPNYISLTCWLLLIAELFLNVFIVERVSYTEIDWKAYMQEVEGFLNGSLDYAELKGDTGPCVYPAGFLYIYTAFYYITSYGTNIKLGQYIFIAIYLAQSYVTYEIYKKTCKVPAYALALSAITSYRIHSIYVLRMFNDPIAVLLFYISLNLLMSNRWKTASLFFSLAVSIKMNILLYAPVLLMAYLICLGYKGTFVNLTICGVVQLLFGLPFLYGNPYSYLKASFDLGRVFEHKWTVNYRFLDRDIFESKWFHFTLLSLHIILLLAFLSRFKRYIKCYATLRRTIEDLRSETVVKKEVPEIDEAEEELTKEQQDFLKSFEKQIGKGAPQQRKPAAKKRPPKENSESADEKCQINFSSVTRLLVLPFFVANLIGIACARSLHYQFYSWYYHSLLYLVFSTNYKKRTSFLLLGLIEYCWNVYPSTDVSSALLHVCHVMILWGVYKTMA